MNSRPTPTRTAGLKATLDDIATDGWEIRRAGPAAFVVTTRRALDDIARQRVKGHFLANTKVRFSMGELA
jgi:hypothetical protein